MALVSSTQTDTRTGRQRRGQIFYMQDARYAAVEGNLLLFLLYTDFSNDQI